MPEVKILKPIIAGKKPCKAGDIVKVTDREARNLVLLKKAEILPEEKKEAKKTVKEEKK